MPDPAAPSVTERIEIPNEEDARRLSGRQDCCLRLLRDVFDVRVVLRNGTLSVTGEAQAASLAARMARDILNAIAKDPDLPAEEIERLIRQARPADDGAEESAIEVYPPRRRIVPRTQGQARYVRAMERNDLVFCVGPAGSGKTYLAVAMAVAALKSGRVRKIILTRPAVEAGEKLGFLPGDMQAKVNPYLRPLYDALQDMMPMDQVARYMERDVLEVAPLAYMRGRTLESAFIILDEGQNCTGKQMRMFLTRLGASSKSVVTGDISQTDLPASEVSGMIEAIHVLRSVRGIGFVRLMQSDIIRHRLVQDIVDAYEADEAGSARRKASDPAPGGE